MSMYRSDESEDSQQRAEVQGDDNIKRNDGWREEIWRKRMKKKRDRDESEKGKR